MPMMTRWSRIVSRPPRAISTARVGERSMPGRRPAISTCPEAVVCAWTPYWEIRLKDSSSTLWMYDGDGNYEMVISVAGTWGYAATAPHDIRQACLMIADSIYRRRVGENTSSTVKVTAFGVVITPQDVPSMAAGIIQKYRRRV